MSDLMLQAVLRMPPDLWRDDAWDVKQRHGRYVQAADELEALRAALDQERADNERLREFTRHDIHCERVGFRCEDEPCTCGLDALLAACERKEG